MDFWTAQRDLVQGRIAEIEGKLAQQRQLALQVRARGADATVHIRLINILKEGWCAKRRTLNTSTTELWPTRPTPTNGRRARL